MMHQGKRLLSIAQAMECVVAGREPLKLLFLLIAAENISKLHVSTDEDGRSRYHTKRFFRLFCTNEDKEKLLSCLEITQQESTLDELIDVLYDIRCDVVHEGTYWGFDFATPETPSVLTGLNPNKVIRVKIKYQEFQDIVARGVICATQELIRN